MANGRKCKQCGVDLTGRQESFCSDECRATYHNGKRKETKKCLNCGAKTTTKYCSKKCGVKYRNRSRSKEFARKVQLIEDTCSW